ncbi:ExbD/TolR family protein [Fimbriimonas ginsengisoli]|uniref:Biopolymer transport protein ExbD/TolR n=1 Tax=Fimbriimonas ginsengisoli Gsoil 348 TaxID=661478 RepID=A0A068NSY6_FIMGI|nr:biopolymer transporter ExbD [Fimbriimonas ginsengisoli]AIE86462.1 Biopolymer transport protein ExbD/TolR [Fimbriimonas ginsengisoli Gsoil 348]
MRSRVKIGRRRQIEEPEIIVIPMIDVMMFLLFFFMVASLAMAVQNGLPVSLPKASTGKDQRAMTVTITLQPDGSIYLNTSKITIDKLGAGLTALGVGSKTLVTLNSDEHVPYGTVVAVMDEGRKAGVTNFAFATNRR